MENDTVCVASLNGRHLKQLFITRATILFLIYGIFYLLLFAYENFGIKINIINYNVKHSGRVLYCILETQ